ncbi:MAG: amino acid adenylation domain-containing protein [Ruminococcus sp.]|nr:amino acid adenylation domain-containing protein [Ruminococcus sp.]
MSKILSQIQQLVSQYPDRLAVVDGERSYTFSELDTAARRIASLIAGKGVRPGDAVTVELPRCREYIAAMLGAWYAGAAYAPLSVSYPADRLEFIRENCSAKAVIDEKLLRGIELAQPAGAAAELPDTSPALYIYTSGSTGKPKGVRHSFASVDATVERYASLSVNKAPANAAVGVSFAFIAAAMEIFSPLTSGMTAVIVPDSVMKDPVQLADFLYDNDIAQTFISPKMLRVLKPKGSSLRQVLTGSERISDTYSEDFTVTAVYGQSELGIATAFTIDKEYSNTPIGKPFPGTAAYILGEDGTEADEGELCLAGCFADCYLDLPEQTEKTFVPNPFAERDGFERMVRTGDIVRRGEDGNIIYLNRRDWMVKINGQRVEPGEIEAVIREVPGVREAAVRDHKNSFGQVYLAAYFAGEECVDAGYIKSCIADKLPSYMVPAFFIKLDRLPVNANGKLDRSALEAPEAGAFKAEYAEPVTDMQKALCAAFEKVLGVEQPGIDDDFFALGGDSIRAAAAAAECAAFGIGTSDIFSGRTPRETERIVLGKAAADRISRKAQRETVYPLTPYERGMYLEQKMSPDSTVYLLNLIFTVRGSDTDKITAALKKIFSLHEALHSYYSEKNGLPVRVVTEELPEISVTSAASQDEARSLAESYAEPFDLNGGIPVRPTVYELPDGSAAVHIAVHHIAFDGGSAPVLFEEFTAALRGDELSEPEIDLSDIYEASINADFSGGLDYYRGIFADGVPVTDLPIRSKRPKVHPLSDRELIFDYDAAQVADLDRTAKRFGLTEFELIFSAAAMTAAKYTASEDLVLGIPTNMRPVGAESVIGMFVNTAPVRIKPRRAASLEEFFSETSKAVRSVTYGAALPFEDVAREFVKQRDESRNPMFDISVNYMWMPPEYDDGSLKITFDTPLQKMSRDIGIIIRKTEKGLRFMMQYSSELFDDSIAENFAAQLRHTLALTGNGAETVRAASQLPEDQQQALERCSREAEAEVEVQLLHKLFEREADAHPVRTALIAVDAQYTYKQLDDLADRVANNLIKLGVEPGGSVAILLPRVSAFFACMFGINKAGAAFIPCDPQYPADRINHIITDSEASFIITTKDKLADYPPEKAIDIDSLLAEGSTERPDIELSSDSLSYMIYTSGSTGKPKGVMLHHKGICNYLMPHPANPHMHFIKEQVENYLSVTTVSFDMSFKEHAAALCNGKTLVFAGDDQMNDPRELAKLMDDFDIDCINATPSRLMQYLEYEPFAKALARCKLVMSGGEGYPMSLRDRISKLCPDTRIMNTYGPTEITVSCNAADLTDADHISVGRPLLNYTEYIVDKFGDLSPYGAVGELLIGGVGVARGYKGLDKMTAERFIDYNGERVYRSGDYAKWDSEGKVMILGRLDNQVKLRGLRIELDEIIGLIEAQPHIKKAAVVIRMLGGQENLCAYFTADTQINAEELRAELKKHLTHYMVPTAYLQMAELPMTPNGKTDLKRLPEPAAAAEREYEEPANDRERFFCETFGKALGIDRVGALDDFFEIGGTSLIVTSVVLAASEKGWPISYGDVFKYTTPRALAELFGKDEEKASKGIFDFDDYDYTKINELLSRNNIESFINGESRELGNIMITGVTGYMGAHLLAQYLDGEEGRAWCMVRKGRYPSAADRLRNLMFYYFGGRYASELAERVTVHDGDVTDYTFFEPFEKEPISTVFNCAANVKHFSSGTDIEDINVGGAVNCVKLCEKLGARLIHFSTISVGGTTDDLSSLSQSFIDEQSLYFGQTLDNKYTASKLMSERTVLEAAAEKGLDAKVIRVGTLAARESDGEFQINFLTNSFMGRLRSYSMLGCFPYQMIENQVCMGPIDLSCKAFLKLARTPKECCLYNAVNNHTLPLGDIIRRMNLNGMDIRFVEYEEFAAAVSEAQKDPDKAAVLQSMVAYMSPVQGKQVVQIPFAAHYTTQILARLGFFWNASSDKYVDDFISTLGGFSFFDKDNLGR